MDRDAARPTAESETLINEANLHIENRIVIKDWSLTGRGSHVDFGNKEVVPLEQGRFLGRGAMGDVHETVVQGRKLAHKKILFRRKIGDKEKTEIEILKRLSHVHILQLVGTYTQQKILGILTYPVAVCDLHTFFEDVEAWSTVEIQEYSPAAQYEALDPIQKARLKTLGYNFPAKDGPYKASPVYSKIGCLISAVAYLHDQKIRHKDLKPSNILLSRDRLWLSDFGSATDFTLLSQSATDSERGTPRYFAPEVAGWKLNGRAADVFSLGCVLLEVLVMHDRGTLEHIRRNRSPDPSFHANLDRVETWLQPYNRVLSPRRYHLQYEIKAMLSRDPAKRPTVQDLLIKITACDLGVTHLETTLCEDRARMQAEHEEQTWALKKNIDDLKQDLRHVADALRTTSIAFQWNDEDMQARESHLNDEIERRSSTEMMMREFLAERQKQDIRIAQLEKELKSKTTIIEQESQKPRVHGLEDEGERKSLIRKALLFDNDSVPKLSSLPPKNRSYNITNGLDKSEKGDKQRSQRAVPPGGGPTRRWPYDPSYPADDEDDEEQAETMAAPSRVSNLFTDTVTVPPLRIDKASELFQNTEALQIARIPLEIQRRPNLEHGGTSSFSTPPAQPEKLGLRMEEGYKENGRPYSSAEHHGRIGGMLNRMSSRKAVPGLLRFPSTENLELGMNELDASNDKTSEKHPSYPSPASAVRQRKTPTKTLADRNKKATRKGMHPRLTWKSVLFSGKATSSDVAVSGTISRSGETAARSTRDLRDKESFELSGHNSEERKKPVVKKIREGKRRIYSWER